LKADLKNKYIIQLADRYHTKSYVHEKTVEKKIPTVLRILFKIRFEAQILIFQLQTLLYLAPLF
jgi:hypothetical protein